MCKALLGWAALHGKKAAVIWARKADVNFNLVTLAAFLFCVVLFLGCDFPHIWIFSQYDSMLVSLEWSTGWWRWWKLDPFHACGTGHCPGLQRHMEYDNKGGAEPQSPFVFQLTGFQTPLLVTLPIPREEEGLGKVMLVTLNGCFHGVVFLCNYQWRILDAIWANEVFVMCRLKDWDGFGLIVVWITPEPK